MWQKKARTNDEDYKKNQNAAQYIWAKKNRDYWRKYRENNPHYTERNRKLQKIRNLRSKDRLIMQTLKKEIIAKMDECEEKNNIISRYYILYPVQLDKIARMDGIIVKIEVITSD
jgi:hypothetical protein